MNNPDAPLYSISEMCDELLSLNGEDDHTPPTDSTIVHCDSTPMNFETSPKACTRSAEQTAALFLLTFQEKYKLSQRAINFAVGSINCIVDSVLKSAKVSVQESLLLQGESMNIGYCDHFSSLQTEHQQSILS